MIFSRSNCHWQSLEKKEKWLSKFGWKYSISSRKWLASVIDFSIGDELQCRRFSRCPDDLIPICRCILFVHAWSLDILHAIFRDYISTKRNLTPIEYLHKTITEDNSWPKNKTHLHAWAILIIDIEFVFFLCSSSPLDGNEKQNRVIESLFC